MGKKAREMDKYTRDLEEYIEKYVEATGDQSWTMRKVAAWMVEKGVWEQQKENAVKDLARQLSRVAQKVTITDDSGRKVRKYHAFRLGADQPMLWADMGSITRQQMDESKTMRRNNLAAGCVQLYLDLEHYNKKHNPGDALLFDPNFTNDIADMEQPAEYNDSPPEDDSQEGSS